MSIRSAGGSVLLKQSNIPNLTTMSWCGWFWFAAQNGSSFNILAAVVRNADATNSVGIGIGTTGLLLIFTPNTGNAPGTRTVALGSWHHAAMVRDGSNHWGYLDGQLEIFRSDATSNASADTTSMFGVSVVSTLAFNGRLQHSRWWSGHALSQPEIVREMRSQSPVSRGGLWANHPLVHGSDLTDRSGSGHDWSVTGTPTTDPDFAIPRVQRSRRFNSVSAALFRKTLSGLGTRAGSRQAQGVM